MIKRINEVQHSIDYLNYSLFCTLTKNGLFWVDLFNARNLFMQQPVILRPVTLTRPAEKIPEMIMRGIKFLMVSEKRWLDKTTEAWYSKNSHLLGAHNMLHAFIKILNSGDASRGIFLLKKFGLLQVLCPPMLPFIGNPDYSRGTRNFDYKISGEFRARATSQNQYWDVLVVTLAFFLFPAKNFLIWETLSFKLTAAQIEKITQLWKDSDPSGIPEYWNKTSDWNGYKRQLLCWDFWKSPNIARLTAKPTPQTSPYSRSLNSSPNHN